MTPETEVPNDDFSFDQRPFLKAIFDSLSVEVNDHGALFALSLLYALGHNSGELIFRGFPPLVSV